MTPISAPVALLALAAAMPFAAGEAAALGGVAPAAVVAGATHDRAETIARCVSEAARQFCGDHVAAITAVPAFTGVESLGFTRTVTPQPESPHSRPVLLPSLIDLPPPVR